MEYNYLFSNAALLMGDKLRWQTELEFHNIVFIILLMAFCLFQHNALTPKMTLNPTSIICLLLTIPSRFLSCENY